MTELEEFRAEKDEFFRSHPQSPLTPEQRRNFRGLEYFPENDAFRLEVKVEPLNDPQPIQMQTTTGDVQFYFRHGRFKFSVDGQEAELTIYRNENGYFLPFVDSLAGAEIELVDEMGREFRLKTALESVDGKYDYILVDCPPSLGILTVNGLVAAKDGVLVPVQCEYLALEGLGQLTQTIQRVQSLLFPDLRVRGVILTMFDSRTNLSNDVVKEVNNHFPGQVFKTIVPRSIRLAEAPSYGLPISAYAPASVGASAYESLVKELLKGDGVK